MGLFKRMIVVSVPVDRNTWTDDVMKEWENFCLNGGYDSESIYISWVRKGKAEDLVNFAKGAPSSLYYEVNNFVEGIKMLDGIELTIPDLDKVEVKICSADGLEED